jgi:ornithine cyclodeaminase/alanine dehydrogenase-like protein (mu-crystallin family)
MLVLTNQEIERILRMDECMPILEEMYRDLGEGKALFMPRVDNLLPCSHEGAYYGLKHMGGGWPRHRIMALRLNSDILTHPSVRERLRRVKVPAAQDRWVSGKEPGRTDAREITCFINHMGMGLQFAALGSLTLEKAGQLGLGKELPSEWFSEEVHP